MFETQRCTQPVTFTTVVQAVNETEAHRTAHTRCTFGTHVVRRGADTRARRTAHIKVRFGTHDGASGCTDI